MDNQRLELSETAAIWERRVVNMKLSEESDTGFLNVLKQGDTTRKKPYYAKFLPPGEKQQRMLPGSSSSSAWEAAAKLAFHMAGFGGELVAKKERVEARRPSEVRPAAATTQCTSLHFLSHRRCVCVHRRFARKGRQSGSGRMNERRPGQHGWRMSRLANHARTHFKCSLM